MPTQVDLTIDFIGQLRELNVEQRAIADNWVKGVARTLGEAVVIPTIYGPGTPVLTGNARGHWYEEINGQGEPAVVEQQPRPKKDGSPGLTMIPVESAEVLTQRAVERLTAASQTIVAGDSIAFVNETPYIEELNDGSSRQAPTGIVDSLVTNFASVARMEAVRLGIPDVDESPGGDGAAG